MVDNVKVAELSMVDNGEGGGVGGGEPCQWLTTGEGSIVNG